MFRVNAYCLGLRVGYVGSCYPLLPLAYGFEQLVLSSYGQVLTGNGRGGLRVSGSGLGFRVSGLGFWGLG